MAKKLPKVITKEEFENLLEEAKKQREQFRKPRSKKLTPRGKRINEYMIAMILGCHAGMRLSEILGLKQAISNCCNAPVIKKLVKDEKKNKKYKKYFCAKCERELKFQEIKRHKTEYDIQPLTPDKVEKDRIFVSQGKGEKDRWVWKPKLINNQAIQELPLKVSRRAVQRYVSQLSKQVLSKDIHFHTLRHTFATEFLKKNPQDIRTLQILMGHSRIDTTSIYSHVSPDEALKKMEDVF